MRPRRAACPRCTGSWAHPKGGLAVLVGAVKDPSPPATGSCSRYPTPASWCQCGYGPRSLMGDRHRLAGRDHQVPGAPETADDDRGGRLRAGAGEVAGSDDGIDVPQAARTAGPAAAVASAGGLTAMTRTQDQVWGSGCPSHATRTETAHERPDPATANDRSQQRLRGSLEYGRTSQTI